MPLEEIHQVMLHGTKPGIPHAQAVFSVTPADYEAHQARGSLALFSETWPASKPAALAASCETRAYQTHRALPLTALEPLQKLVPTVAYPPVVRTRSRASYPVSHIACRFGTRLRTLRKAQSLTQAMMAARFGIDRSFLSDVERGHKSMSLPLLYVLAQGLHLSLSDLLQDL